MCAVKHKRNAVFLDRDGVIVADKGYMHKISDFRLLSESANAIKKLNSAGFLVIVITNQSGIARGMYTEDDMHKFNAHMISELKKSGATIDAIYFCPHHNKEAKVEKYSKDCDCRKPKPGMILKAAKEHDIDLNSSWMVGDMESDMKAGKAVGCKTIMIDGSKGANGRQTTAHAIANDLNHAVDYILNKDR
ncbi:D-glycero-beta-D-manno-heptose 1,7-bisphosphate 7-phosphatase [Candidatus Micrarchaeota archaeon]|nr:D-glycero-beta-D-manno-heptose 1,7-bisphosphate 7-phosphatase [Candidatus Micrarchaeota archaeon]MBU1165989.1 D-glycero-beta-D-manno-heptose 1,7-bisphosphate 7-phosphatase [Candidatus Micrarchaeota archaeon]MBU1886434.1 D-glycero-beta-D-manno-heptose 1,7-bisphosphate 7-phosphatase [Candidatus Micrarchaeota archaeon]